jgi:signal transduction histidine kinase
MSDSSSDRSAESIQRLMDQYTEIARLAGALAHEIKNPLSTIRLNMELLAEELDDPNNPVHVRAQNRLGVMQRECQRLQVFLDDFLNFAKLRRLNLQASDLNHEIDELLDFFEPEAADAGIELVRCFGPDVPSVLLDREAFRAALWNLVINAKQSMAGGGQLTVGTLSDGDSVVTYLIDTGCGMDEATAAQMFDAFFSTKPGGSGLGLPTTSKIIEAHGGRIGVESEVGHGTRITVELPAPPRLAKEEAGSTAS